MPVPSPRNSIRIARGNYADLNSNVNEIGDGELCFALDQDKFYSKSGGVLVEVGKGTALATLGQIADIDVAGVSNGQFLQYNSTSGNWEAGVVSGAPVDSVNGQIGVVVIDADDISDASTTNKFATEAELNKLAGIAEGAEVNTVSSVAGRTGDVTLTSGDVGLGNVDNTSDADKPVSTATQTALNSKADLVGGFVPTSQIPAIAITEFLGSVADETAMLALTGQPGDWCLRTDKAVGYVIVGADPSLIGNWEAFTVPGSAVTTVNTQVGDVVLGAADVGAATAAQGLLADTATQPGDNISTLTNDSAFIDAAGAPVQSVNGSTGAVTLTAADVGAATAAQGTTADSALQPNTSIAVTGIDVSGVQTSNIASATYSVDCSLGNYFTASINGSGTFGFSNVPAAKSYGLTIEVTHISGTISWPASVTWPKETAPELTAGKTHLFVLITDDGGTRWRGAALVDYAN